ncbi:MAG: T9SS type A sorting domain-containing protein, partial [Bacteroidales bacterium]|nr:T9SS type A sorting domain-containing protein [Bacteroidales bacterium]
SAQGHVLKFFVKQTEHCLTSVFSDDRRFDLKMYPNPVSGMLTVELDGELFNGEVTLVLFDGAGRKLQEVRAGVVPVDRSLFFLEMDRYTPGVYYLRIADSAGPRVSVPVVKE